VFSKLVPTDIRSGPDRDVGYGALAFSCHLIALYEGIQSSRIGEPKEHRVKPEQEIVRALGYLALAAAACFFFLFICEPSRTSSRQRDEFVVLGLFSCVSCNRRMGLTATAEMGGCNISRPALPVRSAHQHVGNPKRADSICGATWVPLGRTAVLSRLDRVSRMATP
jgi:hypothetical protein